MTLPLLLALLLAPSPAGAQTSSQQEKRLDISSWGECGFISRYSPNLLPPNCLQSVYNFQFDENNAMTRRNGYVLYNNGNACGGAGKPVKGMWIFDDTSGNQYLIVFSSNSMYSSNQDGTCTVIPGSSGKLTQSAEMECVQSLGFLWCSDQSDQVFQTNVATFNFIAAAPQGSHIGAFRNRILIAGVSGNQTQLYLSGELNGSDWSTNLYPAVSTNPAIIDISGANDGDAINCLMGQFQNQYLIGRNYDLYALSGYSNVDFRVRRISQQLGCIQAKSVQEVNNVLYWMSKRGIEAYTGTEIVPISRSISPDIDAIIAASGNSRSNTQTTQSDWQAGNLSVSGPGATISATISPGDIVPSSWTATDTVAADFVSGTLTNVSTNVVGQVDIYQNGIGVFKNIGGETDASTNWPTLQGFARIGAPPTPKFGSYQWNDPCAAPCTTSVVRVRIRDASDNLLSSTNITVVDDMAYTKTSINTATFTVSQIKLDIDEPQYTNVRMVSVPFLRPTSVEVWVKDGSTGLGTDPYIDMDESISLTTSGNLVSQCFDTLLSTPVWGLFQATLSSATQSQLSFQVQAATACTGTFQSLVSQSTNTAIAAQTKEVIKYKANFTLLAATDTPASLYDASLSAETTGYYITQCVNTTGATSWGLFQANGVSNGGTFTFWISTAATCAAAVASTETWNSQINGAVISAPLANFIASRVLFDLTVATQVPTINSLVFNWNAGSNRPPVSSLEYKDRYYLFYTTNTVGTPVNDHAVVLDYNKKWTRFDDINAYSAVRYINKPYIGDSNSTGAIWQFDSGQADSGTAYTASFKTPDLDFGDPMTRKAFDRAYLYMNANGSNQSAISYSCNYFIDGSTTSYSLGTVNANEAPETAGYFVTQRMQFPAQQNTTGHWLSISCSYTGSNGPSEIYGMRIFYRELPRE